MMHALKFKIKKRFSSQKQNNTYMTAGANLVIISTLLLDSRREIALKELICEKNSANVKNK